MILWVPQGSVGAKEYVQFELENREALQKTLENIKPSLRIKGTEPLSRLIATRCHITVFSVLEINRSRKTLVVCYIPFLQMWTSVNICHHFAKMENVSIMTGAIVVNVRWDSSWMQVEKSVLVSSTSSALVK